MQGGTGQIGRNFARRLTMKRTFILLALLNCLPAVSQLSWTLSSSGLPSSGMGFYDFAVAPGGQIYIVGSSQTWNSYEPRLAWSNNGGATWTGLNINSCDVILPNSILFVGNKLLMCGKNSSGKNYVYASTDYGVNWTLSSAGMANYYTSLEDMAIGPNGHIYAAATKTVPPYGGTNAVILESADNGVAWSELPSAGIANTANVFSLFFDKNGKMYLSGGSSILPNRLYTSTDLGYSWTMSNSGIPSTYYVNDFATSYGTEIYATCTYDDGGSNVEPRMMKSTNSGASWTSAGTLTGLTNELGTLAMLNVNGTLLMTGFGYSSTYFVHKSLLPAVPPTVLTSSVSGITDTKAICGGTVTANGGDASVSRGICWNLVPNPTVFDLKAVAGSGVGNFSATMNNLAPENVYYVRAFATNSVGTSYGVEKTFTTSATSQTFTPAGISELEAKAFEIYPVPAGDFIYFRARTSGANSTYCISDLWGGEVLTGTIMDFGDPIDIRSLAKGVYFLRIDGAGAQKFVRE
jgi:hypothetical protein